MRKVISYLSGIVFSSFVFLFVLFGCKSNVLRSGQKIVFPDVPPIYQGDTIQINLKEIKLIAFINGECWTCLNDFSLWESFTKEMNGLEEQISFMFYVKALDYEAVKGSLKLFGFSHPVYIDRYNSFIRINNFKANDTKWFLINENNEILLAGNSINDKSSKRKIRQIIKRYK